MTPVEVIPAGFTISMYEQKGLCDKKYITQDQKTQEHNNHKSAEVKLTAIYNNIQVTVRVKHKNITIYDKIQKVEDKIRDSIKTKEKCFKCITDFNQIRDSGSTDKINVKCKTLKVQ